MSERYLRQVIVVNKSLSMPAGKLAAMVAHAAMTFIAAKVKWSHHGSMTYFDEVTRELHFTAEEARWLTELDPGIEETGQVSFAKIVCQVASLDELLAVEQNAKEAGLECHRVIDSGCSHNKVGDFVCIAIGPAWPEQLQPVTGSLKVYR